VRARTSRSAVTIDHNDDTAIHTFSQFQLGPLREGHHQHGHVFQRDVGTGQKAAIDLEHGAEALSPRDAWQFPSRMLERPRWDHLQQTTQTRQRGSLGSHVSGSQEEA
jgi:hypothetical protein